MTLEIDVTGPAVPRFLGSAQPGPILLSVGGEDKFLSTLPAYKDTTVKTL